MPKYFNPAPLVNPTSARSLLLYTASSTVYTTMSARLRLLAEQLRVSILERNRLVLLGVEPSQDDEEEMRHSLQTLKSGIEHLVSDGSGHRSPALQQEVSLLSREYRELSRLFDQDDTGSDLEAQPSTTPYRDDFPSEPYRDNPDDARDQLLPHRKSVRFSENLVDNNDTDDQSNHELMTMQQQQMQDQDESLEVLSRSLGRQRELSIQIGSELDEQGELLDDMDTSVTRSQDRLDRARNRLTAFSKKARANSHLSIIVGLLVLLIVLIMVL